jgi:hypothetical protein
VLAESHDRIAKERSMRRRRLKWLWARLKQLSAMTLRREDLLMKLGAAKQRAPSAWRLVKIEVAKQEATFSYRLNREKLRRARRREGRYLLRTNLTESDPAKLWSLYLHWWRWKKRSKTSRAIWPSARSFIKKKTASRRTSSCRFWPIACM